MGEAAVSSRTDFGAGCVVTMITGAALFVNFPARVFNNYTWPLEWTATLNAPFSSVSIRLYRSLGGGQLQRVPHPVIDHDNTTLRALDLLLIPSLPVNGTLTVVIQDLQGTGISGNVSFVVEGQFDI